MRRNWSFAGTGHSMTYRCSTASLVSVAIAAAVALLQMAVTLTLVPRMAGVGPLTAMVLLFWPFFTFLILATITHRRHYFFDPDSPGALLQHRLFLFPWRHTMISWSEVSGVGRTEALDGWRITLGFRNGERVTIGYTGFDDRAWLESLNTLIKDRQGTAA